MFYLSIVFRKFYFNKTGKYSLFLVISLFLFACNQKIRRENSSVARTVEIREQNGQYQLFRNGEPYFIKGAAGPEHLDLIKASGGNSIRVWDTNNVQEILDNAHKNGLTVTLGLRVAYAGKMDYGDEALVAAQLEELKKDVIRYKDHPALLMWGVGNELYSRIEGKDVMQHIKLWQAVNDIAKMIHEVDPNHPTTTMLPNIPRLITRYVATFCEEIDILSFNVFGDISAIPKKVSDAGWDGPFLVSEYGIEGYWEQDPSNRTEWYAQIEPTSGEKVNYFLQEYQELKAADNGKWLGAYVFYWGFKREYTRTWYSLFSERGEQTELVDVMQYLWSGNWPTNRAPSIKSILLNGKKSEQNNYLEGGAKFRAALTVQHLAPEELLVNWEVQKDFVEVFFDATFGQEKETIVKSGSMPLKLCPKKPNSEKAKQAGEEYFLDLQAPVDEGPYRLMIWIVDKQLNKAATSNAVFYVHN